jgi:transcriptional regulator with XRE-family HTH domain
MTIGDYVRQLRTHRGISLSELARQSGLQKSLLSRLENNKNEDIAIETVRILAATLGITIAELMGVSSAPPLPQTIIEAEARVRTALTGEDYIRSLIALHDAIKSILGDAAL